LQTTLKIIGKMKSVRHVALIKPPITTMASGFCVSDPMPVEIAAGSKPTAAMRAIEPVQRVQVQIKYCCHPEPCAELIEALSKGRSKLRLISG
jgi:hypothetical protein